MEGKHWSLYPAIAWCGPFPPILLLLEGCLALPPLRDEYIPQAPAREVMAQPTFVAALGHPLGPHGRQTLEFVPCHRVVWPVSFDFASVRGLPSFASSGRRINSAGARTRGDGPSNICCGSWASTGSLWVANIGLCALPSRRAAHFLAVWLHLHLEALLDLLPHLRGE